MSHIDKASIESLQTSTVVAARSEEVRSTLFSDVVELSKPGIVKMVLVTTAVGFIMAALGQVWTPGALLVAILACVIGTTLSAAGANALNQVMEVRRDALMPRTVKRPMPSGRVSIATGGVIGVGLSVLGVGVLWIGANPAAAAVSLLTILSYTLVYTPLKPVTPLATLIGAVPGALPPLIGWAAASGGAIGGLDHLGAWSIFAIMFVWQVPHFLAIAWKYRDEYGAAGHRVLPVVDPSGIRTGWTVLVWSVTLLPISLIAVELLDGQLGWLYVVVALIAGAVFLASAVHLAWIRSDRAAIRLFVASIIYLPLVLLAMVADAALTALL